MHQQHALTMCVAKTLHNTLMLTSVQQYHIAFFLDLHSRCEQHSTVTVLWNKLEVQKKRHL